VQQDGYHVASPFRNSYLISFLLDLTATIQEDTGLHQGKTNCRMREENADDARKSVSGAKK
jgi:hypothetical protein